MKNKVFNPRVFAIAAIFVFTIAFIVPAPAQSNGDKNASVELKFIGNIENQPVFILNFNNAEEDEFTVVVRDETDNILYRDILKGENLSRKFMINTEGQEVASIKFEVTGKKTAKTIVYEINKKSRVIEDVVVNRKNN